MLSRDIAISEEPGGIEREQPRQMAGDDAGDKGIQKLLDDKDKELRVVQMNIKARLDELDRGVRELKAKIKVKEELLIARRDLSKRAAAAEKELNVKIDKAKEELSAKEKQAALRRTKENEKREMWAQDQKADHEQQETKRGEQAGHGTEMDGGEKPASGGAAEEPIDWDNFDIDIYAD